MGGYKICRHSADTRMIQGAMAFSTAGNQSTLSDAEILGRSHQEPELFAVLVGRYEAQLLRRAKVILRSPEDAQEAVQDAFTKMYIYADRYQEREGVAFSAWAYTILNRVAYTTYKSRAREREQRAPLLPETIESLPDTEQAFVEQLSLRGEILGILAKLPERTSRLLHRQFFQGQTHEEIARAEQLSIAATKTRIHRAKKQFKKIYNEQHKKETD